MGDATNWRYPLLWELSTSWGVSTDGKYPPMGVSTNGRCPLNGNYPLVGGIQ